MASPSRRLSLSFQGRSSSAATKQVGQFQMLETIGEGQYAKVRKALDTTSGELVAVKILDKERMVKLGIQALVKSEIGIWKELVHPHVVRLREVLASEKQIFIVLEYAGGGEVFDRVVAQGRLGEPEAREYFAQLLEALAYLHGKGVVHRDLKHPENLLLSASGQVKLGDFGFAVLLDGLTKEERCRQVGSPNYMAPELLTAAAADPGYELELVDAYDAGCILFVMCAGHLPFPDEGELLFNMIVSGTVARPKHFSDNLQNLLSHVMERDWRRRYKISQIRSHIWMRKESGGGGGSAASSPSPEPVELRQQPAHPPERRGVARGDEMSMTFSNFPVVKVVPKRRESSLSMQSASGEAAPFINCFEFLANVGIFDLSRMVVKSEHNYYAFSSAKGMDELMEVVALILGEEEKLRVEQNRDKWRIRAESRELVVAVQLFTITPALCLVDFKKLRGSALEFARVYKTTRQKAQERGALFEASDT